MHVNALQCIGSMQESPQSIGLRCTYLGQTKHEAVIYSCCQQLLQVLVALAGEHDHMMT